MRVINLKTAIGSKKERDLTVASEWHGYEVRAVCPGCRRALNYLKGEGPYSPEKAEAKKQEAIRWLSSRFWGECYQCGRVIDTHPAIESSTK